MKNSTINMDSRPLLSEDLSSSFSGSTILCGHCDDDKEILWICKDCGLEFCDKCKRMHLISDTDSKYHHVYRFGTTRIYGSLTPDVSHDEHNTDPDTDGQITDITIDVNSPPKIDIQKHHKFECRSGIADNKTVQHIHFLPGGNGEAWVKCGAISDEILLYGPDGKILDRKKFKTPIQDFVITRRGNIIFSHYNKNSLWICQPNENVKEFTSVPFSPNSVCLTSGSDVIVSSSLGLQTFAKFSECAVSIPFTSSGCQFQGVYNMSANPNGDIWVTEKGGWGPGRVVCLDENGKFKHEYKGHGRFNPSGITCDEGGYVYICDITSNNIHIVDKTGKFVSLLLPDELISNPEAVAVRGRHSLWVGDGDGQVHVFKFKQ